MVGLIICAFLLWPASLGAQSEVVVAIQVHGNTLTSTEEIIRASGIAVGDAVSGALLSDAQTRLRGAIKLDSVEVLKRFASISDPTQILILIQVDEGPVRIEFEDEPGPPVAGAPPPRRVSARRSRFSVMFLPILDAEDGYGFTYGGQVAFGGRRNLRRRIVIPASWGGDKRLAAEYQQEFSRRYAPRLRTGALIQRRTHPHFDDDADRTRVWGRTEWPVIRDVQAGVEVAWQSSSLVGQEVDAKSLAADVIIDTRVDPVLPHNAIYVRSAIERLYISSTPKPVRYLIDANGYLGISRGSVLAMRVLREHFSHPAPAFYKSVLGGSRNLRGFRAGYAVGDTLVAASAELRIPTTSPLRMAKMGVNLFADIGTTYDHGQRLSDQRPHKGVGAGVWATAPLFRFSVAVARGIESGVRVHIGAGLTF